MEESNVAVEENYHTSDHNTPVLSKSSGSLVQIESISIDLDIPMSTKEVGNCQHFSIRGYVAEMRKRDGKSYSPFASSSNCTSSEEQLPPLNVPKFRWWRCKNCMREIVNESDGEKTEILSNSCGSRLIFGTTCLHMSSTGGKDLLSEMKHVSASRKTDRNKAIMDESPNNSGHDCKLSRKRNKRKCTVVEGKAVTAGNRTGSRSVRNEIGDPTTEVTIRKQCSTQEIDTKSPVSSLSNNSIRATTSDSTLSGIEMGQIVPHDNRHNSADVSGDSGPDKDMSSPNDGQRTASKTSKQSDVLGCNDNSLYANEVKLSKLPSLKLRESNKTSCESDTVFAESSQCDSRNDTEYVLRRRKARKVRLLTELLGRQANSDTSHAKADHSSLSTMPMVPSDLKSVGAPHCKVSLNENVRKRYKISGKKRKMSQEDDCSLSEMGIHSDMAKRVRSVSEESERRSLEVEISDSRSEEKESDGKGLQSATKSVRIKHRSDKDPGINKKKKEKRRLADGCSPDPRKETTMENGDSNGFDAVNSLYQSSHCASSAGKAEPRLRNSYPSLLREYRDSDLCWNGNKFPEFGHVPSSLMHSDNRSRGESSTKRKNLIPVPTSTEMVTFHPAHNLSAKVGVDLSLNNFREAEKHAEDDITQSKSMKNWPFIVQKGNKSSDPRRKDTTLIRQSNVPESGQSSRKGVICDLNQDISQTSSMWQEIQNSPLLLQKRNLHVPKRMETPHPCHKENLNELGHSDVIKQHRHRRSEESLDQGLPDDVPMEIVELMAKNQYERGLTDTKTKCMIERTNAIPRPYPEVYESGSATWFYPGVTSSRPVHANMKTDVGSSRGSSLHLSHGKRNHVGVAEVQEPQFKLFGNFPQIQQKLSSGGQASASVIIKSRLQHGEEAKPTQFPTVHNFPFGLGISQKCVAQPSDKMIYGQTPASLQKGRTISDIKSGDVKIHNESHPILPKSGNAKLNGVGSLDPYSNETIPAMQLLSLMDRRMPSRSAFNLDANKLLEKPFSPCNYHPMFHMDGQQSILNGSYLSQHRSKESPAVHPGGYNADQASFKSQKLEKSRKSYAPAPFGRSKLEKSVSSRGLLHMTRDSCPKDKKKGIPGTSSYVVLPLQDHNASRFLDLEGHGIPATVLPVKSLSESNICSLNRNPAEFSVPEEGNPFTRRVKKPRIGKNGSSRLRSSIVDMYEQKQRRVTKERAWRLPPLGHAS